MHKIKIKRIAWSNPKLIVLLKGEADRSERVLDGCKTMSGSPGPTSGVLDCAWRTTPPTQGCIGCSSIAAS